MTVAQALKFGERNLRRAGIESHRIDASLILAHVCGVERSWLFAHPEHVLTQKQGSTYADLIDQRRQRIPLVHLTNQREFYGLNFYIDANVLTPRVETEQMVEWALAHTPQNGHVIDIGTGSGAIAIALKHSRPDLQLTATEISPEALVVAKRNAADHHTAIKFTVSDLWDGVGDAAFDCVCTNLPYLQDDADLMPEVTKEPAVALFGGPDGLDLYRRFLAGITAHLKPGGYLFTECDPWQHEALIKEAAKYGLAPIEQGYFILGFQRATE